MPSRREIREAAVQLLYCVDVEGTDNPDHAYDEYWDLLFESDRKKQTKASAKAILHLNQGRISRYNKLVDRSTAAQSLLKTDPQHSELVDVLKKILKTESKWQAVCDTIERGLKSTSDSAIEDITLHLDTLFEYNRILTAYRTDWSREIVDFPQLKGQLESVHSCISGLERIGERISMIERPNDFPEHKEIAHLRSASEELLKYRESVSDIVLGVIKHKLEINTELTKVIENFEPDRIDPVDRAILRLGAYEILFRDDVPKIVAINEAIEIGKRFSSTESASFINGILDKIESP